MINHDNGSPYGGHHKPGTRIVGAIDTIDHPAYSLHLALMDIRVFPIVKSALKGQRFQDFCKLRLAIHRVAFTFNEQWYRDMFNQLIEHHNKCVETHGDYIEK